MVKQRCEVEGFERGCWWSEGFLGFHHDESAFPQSMRPLFHTHSATQLEAPVLEYLGWFSDLRVAGLLEEPGGNNDLECVRRILIAWLTGGSVSEIARRAGCIERSVRNVITDVIYAGEGNLDRHGRPSASLGLSARWTSRSTAPCHGRRATQMLYR